MNPQLLTKAGMALQLGVSVQEVNRRLRTGSLRPYRMNGKSPMFHRSQVDEQKLLARKKPMILTPGSTEAVVPTVKYSGEDASVVFKALGQGRTLIQIVEENGIHPLVVEEASKAYARLQGGLFLSAQAMHDIERMPLDGEFPIESDAQFVDMMQQALEDAACGECQKRTRKVCLACAKSLARKGKTSQPSESSEEVDGEEGDED